MIIGIANNKSGDDWETASCHGARKLRVRRAKFAEYACYSAPGLSRMHMGVRRTGIMPEIGPAYKAAGFVVEHPAVAFDGFKGQAKASR